MKNHLIALVVGAAVVAFTAPVAQAQEQWIVSLCEYTKTDDKNRIRKLLTDNKVNVRKIYDGIKKSEVKRMIQDARKLLQEK